MNAMLSLNANLGLNFVYMKDITCLSLSARKVVVLLLLIHFYCCSNCLLGFCVWSLFCYAVLSVLFSFEIILMGKRAGCFTLIES